MEHLEGRTWERGVETLLEGEGRRLPLEWRFRFDPEEQGIQQGWFKPDFNDASWRRAPTNVPWGDTEPGQEWKVEHEVDYIGVGWYRLTFEMADAGNDVHYRLVFGAVDEACKVWVNGELVLERPYPYKGDSRSWAKPFKVDVTDVAQIDQDNTVAVRVENSVGAGGIWRPVYLVASPVTETTSDDGALLDDEPG